MQNTEDMHSELPANNEKTLEDAYHFLETAVLEAERADHQIINWICKILMKENASLKNPAIEQVCVFLKRFKNGSSNTIMADSIKRLAEKDKATDESGWYF